MYVIFIPIRFITNQMPIHIDSNRFILLDSDLRNWPITAS